MPKNLLGFLLLLSIIPALITLFPLILIIKIILWVIAGFFFILFLFMLYVYFVFAKNDNKLQNILWDSLLEKLSWDGYGKVIDIGTGAGAIAIKLAKRFPNSEVWGVDNWGKGWNYSKNLCEKNALIEGVSDNVTFRKASASKLPFKDDEFDAIISNFVYHEVRDIKDKTDAIKESFRILKKDGKFALQDLFLHEKKFGKFKDLNNKFKEWGVRELNSSNSLVEIKRNWILHLMFRNSLILFGKK